VIRWANHVNLRITMPPHADGQDGHCGNNNGSPDDDTAEQITARVGRAMAAAERLFDHATPVRPAPHKRLSECRHKTPAKYRTALKTCRAEEPDLHNDDLLRGCVFDVCFGGIQYAAQDGISESTM